MPGVEGKVVADVHELGFFAVLAAVRQLFHQLQPVNKGGAVKAAGFRIVVDELRRGRPAEKRCDEVPVIAVPKRVHLRVRRDQRLDALRRPVLTAREQIGMGGHGQHRELLRILIQTSTLGHELQQRLNEVLPADALIRVNHRQHIHEQAGIQRVIRQQTRVQQVKIRACGKVNEEAVALLGICVSQRHDLDPILRVYVIEVDNGAQQGHGSRIWQSAACLRLAVHFPAGIPKAAKEHDLLDRNLSLLRADQPLLPPHVLPVRVIHIPQRVL